MESLEAFFTEQGRSDIQAIAEYMQRYINETWAVVFESSRDEMVARYADIGDSVYGIYGARLFAPIRAQLKAVGLRAKPALPGNFDISREWGPEDDRQRWFYTRLIKADGEAVGKAIGTIVTVFFHDHEQLRIPRPFRIIGLAAMGKADVVAALSQLSEDFQNALEARVEYANYQ